LYPLHKKNETMTIPSDDSISHMSSFRPIVNQKNTIACRGVD